MLVAWVDVFKGSDAVFVATHTMRKRDKFVTYIASHGQEAVHVTKKFVL